MQRYNKEETYRRDHVSNMWDISDKNPVESHKFQNVKVWERAHPSIIQYVLITGRGTETLRLAP